MSANDPKRTPGASPNRALAAWTAPRHRIDFATRNQLQCVHMIAEDLKLKPYAEWSRVRVADPRAATPDQFLDGFRKICADEGPIIEDRLYALYARAAELGRVYGP